MGDGGRRKSDAPSFLREGGGNKGGKEGKRGTNSGRATFTGNGAGREPAQTTREGGESIGEASGGGQTREERYRRGIFPSRTEPRQGQTGGAGTRDGVTERGEGRAQEGHTDITRDGQEGIRAREEHTAEAEDEGRAYRPAEDREEEAQGAFTGTEHGGERSGEKEEPRAGEGGRGDNRGGDDDREGTEGAGASDSTCNITGYGRPRGYRSQHSTGAGRDGTPGQPAEGATRAENTKARRSDRKHKRRHSKNLLDDFNPDYSTLSAKADQ